jgi:hypothetical protein
MMPASSHWSISTIGACGTDAGPVSAPTENRHCGDRRVLCPTRAGVCQSERAAPAAHAWRSQALIAHAKLPSALARSESVLRLSWRMAKIYPTGSSAIV